MRKAHCRIGKKVFEMSPTVSVARAAGVLGVSPSTFYRAVTEGNPPVPVLKIGSRIVVPTKPLLELLGLDELPTNNEPEAA